MTINTRSTTVCTRSEDDQDRADEARKLIDFLDSEADAAAERELDPDEDLTAPEEPSPKLRPDPAEVALELMMSASINRADRETMERQGSVCVVLVPSVGWVDLLSERTKRQRGVRPYVLSCKPDPYAKKGVLGRALLDPAIREVLLGHGVLAISETIELVHPVVVATADAVVTIQRLTREQLEKVATAVCGAPPDYNYPVGSGDVPLDLLEPDILRSALRPDQSADDYLERVAMISTALQAAPVKVISKPDDARWTLDNLHGADDAVKWGRSLAIDMAAYSAGELSWDDVDRGCLLSGPPGCGKTTFAKALAASCGLPLTASSYSEWQSIKDGHLGDVTRGIKDTFAQARASAPCILFIDELDTIQSRGRQQNQHSDWWSAIITALLGEMDGITTREGVVIVAASNHPNAIDPAIRRAGRLDREIELGLPDASALSLIMSEHLGSQAEGLDLMSVSRRMRGCSGADAAKLIRGARRRARGERRDLTTADLLAELLEGRRPRDAAFMKRLAVHEAGHAVARILRMPGTLQEVSIVSMPGAHGYNVSEHSDDGRLSAIENRLVVHLAGRAAEEVLLGEATSGAGSVEYSDLARATVLACAVETQFGLGGSLVWRGMVSPDNVDMFMRMDPLLSRVISERLDRLYQDVLVLIMEHRAAVEAVAEALLEREVLSVEEVVSVIRAVRPRPKVRVRAVGETVPSGTPQSPQPAAF
jgi:cell division protease FtsH